MIICGDRRNLQRDKHHCNTPPIWALRRCGQTQSSPQWRHMKTRLEFTKIHLKDPQTVRNNIIWSDEPQFQASCLKAAGTAHHMRSTIPKVKCAGSSLILWGCFSEEGTEGLVRIDEKLNTPKYWDNLNENPVQSIQNLRRAKGLPSNRSVTLSTQHEWLIHNFVNVLECATAWSWTQSNISGETWKCASATIQPANAWEVKRWWDKWLVASNKKDLRL